MAQGVWRSSGTKNKRPMPIFGRMMKTSLEPSDVIRNLCCSLKEKIGNGANLFSSELPVPSESIR
jgi:hypothetical protein